MIINTINFNEVGEFQALWNAQAWLEHQGFSYGSLCRNEPVALMRGGVKVAKWRNLSVIERLKIDGKMTSPDFRNGPVMVEIYKLKP